MTATSDPRQLSYIAHQAADARVNVELHTGDMTLNIGPQHPATHGTLRIATELDGEVVVRAEPIPGYMHRGYEKLSEVRTYPQVTTLINRIDWVGSFANEVPFILAAERLMEIEAPPRAQWIRTILFELSRIANISLFLGDMGVQLGAITPVFYAFRDRERVLNQIEAATGGRFHPNFDRIGGLKDDLPKGWIAETRDAMAKMRDFCDEMEGLLMGNEVFEARCRGVGVIPEDVALGYGLSGANLRASGVDWDLRRDNNPGLAWDQIEWKVWTHPDGDSFARYWVRLQETREATLIVDRLLDSLPSGPIMAKVPRIIKVPEGEAYISTENPLGEMGYYIVSKGDLGPFRVKIRTPSFNNISIVPWIMKGVYVPDVITILGSLYFILGDIDR
ncbi:MAG TPA: NADH-quinone oxidoreductase subunit D [Acidimicrobiales bacterium]|nr:NADH-quinone oxidoreductase subunit D [Acidimicrobiales bacterium]